MIRPYIIEGVKGRAAPVVMLSEGSHVDVAIFNCLSHIIYDRPCETTEEIDIVWSQQMVSNDEIMKFLESLDMKVTTSEKRFRLGEIEQ